MTNATARGALDELRFLRSLVVRPRSIGAMHLRARLSRARSRNRSIREQKHGDRAAREQAS